MTQEKIGAFSVLGTLGNGAHSTILHIRRRSDSRSFALKVVPINGSEDQKFLKQAQFEYEVSQRLDHPNLIKIHALEIERDWLFRVRKAHLLSEYVNGKTLDAFTRLAIPKLVQIFLRVTEGMMHMHRRGVCHADLKPNNIMLARSGDVKIIDYGLAWMKGDKKDRVQGTMEYMAPEQARHKKVNEQTDIYNFGATMYRLVTWRYPPSPVPAPGGLPLSGDLWNKAIKPVQEFAADAPDVLADLIQSCLTYAPENRPQRMSEIQAVLDRLVDTLVRSPDDRLDTMEW